MNATTENTGNVTASTWAIPRPRTLEELLDREEELATRGIERNVQLLGGDAFDALNLPLHWRRKPLGTSAVVASIALLFAAGRRRGPRGRGGRSSGLSLLLRTLVGSTLSGALLGKLGQAIGLTRD